MAGLDQVAILGDVAPDGMKGEQAIGARQQAVGVTRKAGPQCLCVQGFEERAESNIESDRRGPGHAGEHRLRWSLRESAGDQQSEANTRERNIERVAMLTEVDAG